MAETTIKITGDTKKIKVSDILGLWKVIRIDRGGEISIYPLIRGRFLFNFLEDMKFVCFKDDKNSTGTWELIEKNWDSEKRFMIKLNDTFEFIILEIDEDELIITDRSSKYILDRKL